jgi:hypothetical protein
VLADLAGRLRRPYWRSRAATRRALDRSSLKPAHRRLRPGRSSLNRRNQCPALWLCRGTRGAPRTSGRKWVGRTAIDLCEPVVRAATDGLRSTHREMLILRLRRGFFRFWLAPVVFVSHSTESVDPMLWNRRAGICVFNQSEKIICAAYIPRVR